MKVKEILRQVENALVFENEATKESRTLSDVCTRLYAMDCENNGDADYCKMLKAGTVTLEFVD